MSVRADGNVSTSGMTIALHDSASIWVSASDDYWADDRIDVDVRWVPAGAAGKGAFAKVSSGAQLTLPSVDGQYTLEVRASDPCRSGELVATAVVVDRTLPPVWVLLLLGVVVVGLLLGFVVWRKAR